MENDSPRGGFCPGEFCPFPIGAFSATAVLLVNVNHSQNCQNFIGKKCETWTIFAVQTLTGLQCVDSMSTAWVLGLDQSLQFSLPVGSGWLMKAEPGPSVPLKVESSGLVPCCMFVPLCEHDADWANSWSLVWFYCRHRSVTKKSSRRARDYVDPRHLTVTFISNLYTEATESITLPAKHLAARDVS